MTVRGALLLALSALDLGYALNYEEFLLGANFRLDFDVSAFAPELDPPIHSTGHVTFDAEQEYFDFGVKVAKGYLTEVEDFLKSEPTPPGAAESIADMETDAHLGGPDASLDVKVRLTGSDGLSMSASMQDQGPPTTICIVETPAGVQGNVAQLIADVPPGLGIHSAAPHPNKYVEHEMDEMEKDIGGDSVADLLDEAAESFEKSAKPCSNNELALEGAECIEINVQRMIMSAAREAQDALPPDAMSSLPPRSHMPQLKLYSNKAKDALGKIQIMAPGGAGGRMWFNVTSLGGAGTPASGPVCNHDAMNIAEAVETIQQMGILQGPPSLRRLQPSALQAISEGPVKLYALKHVSALFQVMRVIAPKTRRLLPRDATQLMSKQERESAMVNSALLKMLKQASPAHGNVLVEMPKEGIVSANVVSAISPALWAAAAVFLFVAGVAVGRRSTKSHVGPSDEQDFLE